MFEVRNERQPAVAPAGAVSPPRSAENAPAPEPKTQLPRLQIAGKSQGVSTPLDADVIFLGDVHTQVMDDFVTTDFINANAKPGDVILVEAVPSMQQIDKSASMSTDQVKPDVRVYGWDNMALNNEAAAGVRRLIALNDEMEKEGLSMPERVELERQFWGMKRTLDKIAITDRNKSLADTIKSARETHPGARIFVVGGSLHFTRDPLLLKSVEDAGLHYMTLIPTGMQNSEDETRRYFMGEEAGTSETPATANAADSDAGMTREAIRKFTPQDYFNQHKGNMEFLRKKFEEREQSGITTGAGLCLSSYSHLTPDLQKQVKDELSPLISQAIPYLRADVELLTARRIPSEASRVMIFLENARSLTGAAPDPSISKLYQSLLPLMLEDIKGSISRIRETNGDRAYAAFMLRDAARFAANSGQTDMMAEVKKLQEEFTALQ